MPILDDTMESHNLGGTTFQFSATRINKLEATEYTLVTIAADATGSVEPFAAKIETAIQSVVHACRKSPRADNLLLRYVTFNGSIGVHEVHGFKPLADCPVDTYKGSIRAGGMTNLYDACYSAAGASNAYGKKLTEQDYSANAILVVITDGEDNNSTATPTMLKTAIAEGVTGENVESTISILVGVNVTDARLSAGLTKFQADAGFSQYVEIENATDAKIAKLADFVSRSVSSQSQALNSGGPSRALAF